MTTSRMTFLPIAERELRLAARRRKTYRARLTAAMVAALLGAWAVVFFETMGVRSGRALLQTISLGLFFYSIIAGAQATADSLSIEKREGTLGLLFLTRLKGYDVVLGKLAAHTLQIFYSLIAVCPVLALLITFGGITGGEFARLMLALFNALLFSASVGLLASAVFRGYQATMSYSAVMMVALVGGPLVAAQAMQYYQWPLAAVESVRMLSPFSPFRWATSTTGAGRFWAAFATNQLLAWAFLFISGRIVPRSWQDRPTVRSGTSERARRNHALDQPRSRRDPLRARLLDRNPFLWLAGRSRLKPVWVWVFIAGVTIPVAWLAWDPSDPIRFVLVNAIALSTLCGLVLIFWIGSESSRRLAEERSQGTLEWLLSTPLSVREIVRGQWLALRRQFAGPVCFVIAAQIAVLLISLLSDLSGTIFSTRAWYFSWAGLMLVFVADVAAIGWTGMWMGITAKDVRKASSNAATRIVLLPVLTFLLLGTAVTAFAFWSQTSIPAEIYIVVGIIIGIANAFFWGASSRLLLYRRMRTVATERYTKLPAHSS